jgi:type I restriction enzyme S subunit
MAKPEIRLKGFKGEWKETTIGNVSNSFDYGINAAAMPYDGNNKYLRITDIDDSSHLFNQTGLTSPQSGNINLDSYLLEEGDITFARTGASVGKSYIYDKNDGKVIFAGFLIRTKIKNEVNPHFVFMNSLTKRYEKYIKLISQRSGQPGMNTKELSDFSFLIPSDKKEQKAIVDYFKSLDSMILGVTKKIASLKQMKQACLVSMFPQAGETIPRVRFKGFKGEWEVKRLSDCLDISTERNFDNKFGKEDVLSVSDDFGVMNQIELLGRSYAGKSVSNYGILKTGEIVYTKSPLKSKPFGIVKQNTGKTGIVSVLYAVYMAKEGTAADYIHYYFDPDWRLNDYLRPLVNKGAKNTMNISDEIALTGYIMIPKDISEQLKIASYFRSLDKQISLQEARLEKLKQIKAACLDKMFV